MHLFISSFALLQDFLNKDVHNNDIDDTGILLCWSQVHNHQLKNMQVFSHLCDIKPKSSLCVFHHVHTFCDGCAYLFLQTLLQFIDKQCN